MPASKAPPSPLVQVQAVGVVAGQRELGEGVRAGRDLERRGGVGEGVGGGLDGGAEHERAGAGGDPEVADGRAAAVVVDDALLDDELDRAVFVYVQVDARPGHRRDRDGGVDRIEAGVPPMARRSCHRRRRGR